MSLIKSVIARQVFDSRGNPTVETDVFLNNAIIGRASVPSGASTGKNEAYELRDNMDSYHGKSVFKAVQNVNKIIKRNIVGLSVLKQKKIDQILIKLDGTSNKKKTWC